MRFRAAASRGAVGGAALSLLIGRVLARALEGVGSNDPVVLLSVALLLVLTILLAAFLPARRVTQIDPARCFREA